MANMRMVIISAIISMFGIGAEIGITTTLALLSDAAVPGRRVSFALIVAIGGFALWSGAAAIRTLADPKIRHGSPERLTRSFTGPPVAAQLPSVTHGHTTLFPSHRETCGTYELVSGPT